LIDSFPYSVIFRKLYADINDEIQRVKGNVGHQVRNNTNGLVFLVISVEYSCNVVAYLVHQVAAVEERAHTNWVRLVLASSFFKVNFVLTKLFENNFMFSHSLSIEQWRGNLKKSNVKEMPLEEG
jgi:hypothetical protein